VSICKTLSTTTAALNMARVIRGHNRTGFASVASAPALARAALRELGLAYPEDPESCDVTRVLITRIEQMILKQSAQPGRLASTVARMGDFKNAV